MGYCQRRQGVREIREEGLKWDCDGKGWVCRELDLAGDLPDSEHPPRAPASSRYIPEGEPSRALAKPEHKSIEEELFGEEYSRRSIRRSQHVQTRSRLRQPCVGIRAHGWGMHGPRAHPSLRASVCSGSGRGVLGEKEGACTDCPPHADHGGRWP